MEQSKIIDTLETYQNAATAIEHRIAELNQAVN